MEDGWRKPARNHRTTRTLAEKPTTSLPGSGTMASFLLIPRAWPGNILWVEGAGRVSLGTGKIVRDSPSLPHPCPRTLPQIGERHPCPRQRALR